MDSKEINISSILVENFPTILEIANKELGKDYINYAELQNYISTPNKIGLVGKLEDKVIGFSLAEIIDPKDLSNIILTDHDWFLNYFSKFNKLGYMKHTVVNSPYKKRGAGTLLNKKITDYLSLKSDVIFGTAWNSKGKVDMENIFKKEGFKPIKTIFNYWEKDSIIKKYTCPTCGNPPCTCSTVVFVKE